MQFLVLDYPHAFSLSRLLCMPYLDIHSIEVPTYLIDHLTLSATRPSEITQSGMTALQPHRSGRRQLCFELAQRPRTCFLDPNNGLSQRLDITEDSICDYCGSTGPNRGA